PGPFSFVLTGLQPNQTYHYQAVADGQAAGTAFGSNISFQTPAGPPPGTKIAFTSLRNGNSEIYVMNPDGSNQTRLTNNPAEDRHPNFSPDGSKIAFASNRDGNFEIYVMNADGTNPVRLTNNPASDRFPRWSPDGTKIAFVSNRDGTTNDEIYVMNADGSNQTRLTNSPGIDTQPAWSPDGSEIVFISMRTGHNVVHVMNADGSNVRRYVFGAANDQWPQWAPANKIVWSSAEWATPANGEIWTMSRGDTMGVGKVKITNNEWDDITPCWSPDGTKIAFASYRDPATGAYNIYVMNADGSNPVRLTNTVQGDTEPSWGGTGTGPAPTVAPVVATMAATNITHNSADLHGELFSLGSATVVEVKFEWGASGSFTQSTVPEALTAPRHFSFPLTGLAPQSSLNYRAKADGGAAGVAIGPVQFFTTLPAPVVPGPQQRPPQVTTMDATSITPHSAILRGGLTFMGSAPQVDVWFEWGTQSATVLNTTPRQTMFWPDSFGFTIGGLVPDTDYRFRAIGDGGFAGRAFGPFVNFRTAALVNIEVSTMTATNIQSNSATLNG
ncbi:MAG: hypothetical protein N3E40_05415, partial [Dehalococcoidia bacterium]|nr:hypothetical protein [Dehalococcoidia bacterium]